jgi:hypothetical protein
MSHVLQAEIQQAGPTVAKGLVRSHTVTIDRPTARGGTDQGPLGGEYLLIALGGCFMSNLLAAIRVREASVTDVRRLGSRGSGLGSRLDWLSFGPSESRKPSSETRASYSFRQLPPGHLLFSSHTNS